MNVFLRLLFLTGLLLCGLYAQAQTPATVYSVRGKVKDAKDSTGLVGVTVAELDKDNRIIKGVTTDIDGNYVIRMSNENNILAFSSIGYKNVRIPARGRKTISTFMESSANEMNEVVVRAAQTDNGLLSVSERNSTLAVAKIDAKALEEMQGTSIDQMMQGRLSGVDIAANSGDPGAGMQIRIRGTSSINSSVDPLIVVDGMPYETQIPSDFNFGAADELGYAQLLNIPPSDIKTISILKDAAATALWGSRAASGVVVINTKRGAVGKPVITYTFKGSVSQQPNAIPMLSGDQYSSLIPEEYMNRSGLPLNTQQVKEFQYDPNDPYWFNNYSNNTNWIDRITQIGNSYDHNLAISGGGEKARYYASLGYFSQRGTTIGTGLDRINTRINLDYNVSNRIRFRTDLAFTHSSNDRNYVNSNATQDLLRSIAYTKMPNMSVNEYNEFGVLTPNYFSPLNNIQGQYPATYNPVAMANSAKNTITTDRIIPHFQLQYDLKPNVWMLAVDVQFDINNTKSQSFLPQIATGQRYTSTSVNQAYDGDADVFGVITKSSLLYTPQFTNTDHQFSSLWVLNTSDNKSVTQQASIPNTPSDLLQDVTNSGRQTASTIASSVFETRTVGLLWNVHYGYKGKYNVDVGVRGDGNSRFGPAYRYGVFPSISGKWNISDEPFMQRFNKYLDFLGLRASYGQTGNAPRYDYTFFGTYTTLPWSYLGSPAIVPATMELQNLRWETLIGQNFGLNLIMFKRRITLDAELYKNRTNNLFFRGLQIPSYTGFNNVDMNVGTLDNQGWELNLGITPYKTKNITIDLNMNIARNINIIREISDLYPRESGNITANGQYKSYIQENNPFGSFYGFRYKGVYKDEAATVARGRNGEPIITPDGQGVKMRFNYPATDYIFQPGDAIYEDINHDGNINYQDIVYLGNSNPAFTGGFGGSIGWRDRLKLTAFFNFRSDYDIVNGTRMSTTAMYSYDNQSTEVLSRWRQPGDVTNVPRALYGAGYNWLGSSRYVEDASFLRFRTVTLRYTFAKQVLDKLRLKALSGYLTVENLYTWSNYKGQNPEVSLRGNDPFRIAIDYSMTPPAKTVTLGLTASF
ncbi:SusC/RagA family TonB-linked outer membrane protein [uncultured Fibrella sp.]|uniref:SusC/RagA family TonB-linked outer membrane protein n=1 Tax=uncultured Fibrella sp. TaxID=1284596 RepID=UPI0035CC5876